MAMGDPLKKVKPGDKLRIPATTYNAFIDTTRAFQASQRNIGSTPQSAMRSSGIVLVRNDSGNDLSRYSVLGIDSPIIDPEDNLDAFKNKVAVVGVTPSEDDHVGKFVILLEPLKSKKIGMAYGAGICPVKIDVPDEDVEYPYADIADGKTANLKAKHYGAATILWREGGTGVQWALVRLGPPLPTCIFPVKLKQTGGEQGDEENPATWTYDVIDPATDDTLAEDVDPTSDPHQWKRPSVGYMIEATFGYAHYNKDNDLVLGWINEQLEQASCQDAGDAGGGTYL
ncbi:MAG: hypothetical protein FWD61_01110 [Phycisphaerales bacterium]|nr:hypothetical protein [Phycisphaerales bacterium]